MTALAEPPPTAYGLAPLWEIHLGDVREQLAAMPDSSVNCIVTSPPYWGLRDYGTGAWEGGDPVCNHQGGPMASASSGLRNDGREHRGLYDGEKKATSFLPQRSECRHCGAIRVDSQIGLEKTPAAYVENLVAVFREARRVLTRDGSLWLNLGDSYAGSGRGPEGNLGKGTDHRELHKTAPRFRSSEIKPKDLVGIPWRVAFALQDDGWFLRAGIIWAKPNPMPESVTDRPTRSHEMVFLLTKSPRYYYDARAIAEEIAPSTVKDSRRGKPTTRDYSNGPQLFGVGTTASRTRSGMFFVLEEDSGLRNARDVWTITPEFYDGAHFATFPTELARRCIVAGSPAAICEECGKPWTRRLKRANSKRRGKGSASAAARISGDLADGATHAGEAIVEDLGFWPTCYHVQRDGAPAGVVLDPFLGSGTTVLTALNEGRRGVGIELNPEYVAQARARIIGDKPLLNATSEGRFL